jgi:hypothetical protein
MYRYNTIEIEINKHKADIEFKKKLPSNLETFKVL